MLFSKKIFFISSQQMNFWNNQLAHFQSEESIFKRLNNANYYLNKGRAEILEDILKEINSQNK